MHHVFLVHSHITYAVAAKVVEHERIDKRSVVLLASRGFLPPEDRLRLVPIDYSFDPESFPRQANLLDSRRRLRAMDHFLRDLVAGDRFHFYTPQTGQRFIQIIKSSPRCAGFSYLEEGLGTYLTREELEKIDRTKRATWLDRISYAGRIGDASFYDEGQDHAYCVHSAAFPGMQGRVVLHDVFSPPRDLDLSAIRTVIVCDGMAWHGQVRSASLLHALDRVLDELRDEGVTSVHFKLHPAQVGTDEENAIHALFRRHAESVAAKALPNEVSLEQLAFAAPHVRYLIGLSSAGLYAALMGRTVRSYARYVCEVEPEYACFVDQLPSLYRERLQFLGDADLF